MTTGPWAAKPPLFKISLPRLTLIAVIAASAPGAALAQTERDDEIIVSALRTPTSLADTGSAVSVITADMIRTQQYAFVADALKDAAGVSLARNGGAGAASTIRLRGAASGQTLVIIDGVIANDPAAPQGGFNFANLGADSIDRIEILRGPQSLLYGADAIGGVIAIETKKENGVDAFIEGGSRGSVRGGVAVGGATDKAYGRLTVDGVTTDGISRAAGGAETDGYKNGEAAFSGGAVLSDYWRTEAVIRVGRAKTEIDGFPPPLFSFADTNDTETTKSHLVAGKLIQDFQGFDGVFSLSYARTDRTNKDQDVETFSASGERLTADYVGVVKLSDRLRLIGGGKWEETTARTDGVDETATAGAAFLVSEIKPTESVTFSAGLRRDEFSNFDGATTARLSAVWRLDNDMRLRASWGQGFRAPSLFELTYDQFGILPNPDLRPERANGFDAGFDSKFGGDGKGRFSLTLFHTQVKDQIDFDFAGNGYFNIASTRARGAELEGGYALTPTLTVDLTYSFTDAINKNTSAQLLRVPKHKGTATLNITPVERLKFSASLHVNGRENDTPSANDSFVRVDLRAAYDINDQFEIYGRIENASDADYQDVSGYGEPGLSAFAGLRAHL
ncbi:TonB-dependent receptor plug domain-containing protein [Marinicaulis aureus]|uniref:TonB-dependent receptor plug domain-containing protein n=1 Tax=Hyphococcus aureus TaxID=2666033 RepID=A0ABW1KVF9_9PROT